MSPRRADPKKQDKPSNGGAPSWMIPVGIGALVVIAIVALYTIQSSSTSAPPSVAVSTTQTTGRTKGDPNAKVEFVEFSDYQWPYCKDFALGAERQLDQLYFKTGKVKFTYRYYPVVDQGRIGESHWAAYAAECANLQGKFWDYHDKLFAVWTGENVGTYTKDKLKTYAAGLGLDAAKFNTCLDTEQTKSVIDTDKADATRFGIQGTPTFLLNGRLLQIRSLDVSEFSRSFDLFLK